MPSLGMYTSNSYGWFDTNRSAILCIHTQENLLPKASKTVLDDVHVRESTKWATNRGKDSNTCSYKKPIDRQPY